MRRPASFAHLPPPPPENLRQRAVFWQYRTAWEAAARLPEPLARRLPARIGDLWYRMAADMQRSQVRANLARVVPGASARDLDDLARAAYRSYARYWLDSFRLHTMDAGQVVAASATEGLHHVDAVRDRGQGGILATAHLGSWDVGALFANQRGWRMVVVAEMVEPRRLFERFVRLREQAGIAVVPLVRGGNMLEQLESRISHDAGLATLLADRDLTRKGPIVEFFGEPCRLPPGTAALARRTGLPVNVGAFMTEGDGFRAVVQAPVDIAQAPVQDGMQVVARELERLIGRFPAQWHVFVPNWLADREPAHPVAVAWRDGDDWRELARADWQRRRRRFERANGPIDVGGTAGRPPGDPSASGAREADPGPEAQAP